MITPHTTIAIPEDFNNEIEMEIPELNFDHINLQLRQACIDFCTKTHYWIENIDDITIVADQYTYPLSVTSANKAIVCVKNVYDEENKIVYEKSRNVSYGWDQSTPETIDIFSSAVVAGSVLSVEAVIKPKLSGDIFLVSSALLSEYRYAILAKAKTEFYRIPRKPWTDLSQAQINESIYIDAVAKAKLSKGNGYSQLPYKTAQKKRQYF